jgi:hypothetical protein
MCVGANNEENLDFEGLSTVCVCVCAIGNFEQDI